MSKIISKKLLLKVLPSTIALLSFTTTANALIIPNHFFQHITKYIKKR